MTWEASARSGGAAESWVAYAMGVNDFDVGQMIGGKAQSTDLLVSKDRKIWRIEVKSSSQGPTEASFTIQNPIADDENLVYAFVWFDVKAKKQTLDQRPQLFFVKSTELNNLKIKKTYDDNKKKEVWEVRYQGNFRRKSGSYSKHKDNWNVFKGRKGRFLPEKTNEKQLINSYHRLFLDPNMPHNEMVSRIKKSREEDLEKLSFKKKYTAGETFPFISTSLGIRKHTLRQWRDEMGFPKKNKKG